MNREKNRTHTHTHKIISMNRRRHFVVVTAVAPLIHAIRIHLAFALISNSDMIFCVLDKLLMSIQHSTKQKHKKAYAIETLQANRYISTI